MKWIGPGQFSAGHTGRVKDLSKSEKHLELLRLAKPKPVNVLCGFIKLNDHLDFHLAAGTQDTALIGLS